MLTTKSYKQSGVRQTKTVIGKVSEPEIEIQPASSDAEEAHSKLGPSASERWLECPGSVLFTADMPGRESIYADEGNAAHTLSEWVRETGRAAKSYIGEVITVNDNEFTVNAEMATAVQQFVDYCEEFEGEPMYEERVHYTAWVPTGWGTSDDIRLNDGGTCHITDLKYGKGVQVYSKGNPQLLLYALGVFQDFGHLYEITDFHITIHQPRLNHVDEVWVSLKELLVWARDVVKPTAELAMQPGAPFKAGGWCQFCPGKFECEARTNAMHEELDEFEDLDGNLTKANQLPNHLLGKVLDRAKEIRSWLTDCEARGLSQVQQRIPVTGKDGDYKLVEGRSSRAWKSAEAAEKALRGVSKLKVSDIFTKKLITAPQAEKLLGKNHDIMKNEVEKPQGRPVLVPASDPRPEFQVNVEDEFEDLSD